MQTKQQIDAIWLADEPRLRRLQGDIKKRSRQGKPTDRLQAKFSDMLAQSRAKVAARRQAVLRVTYPDLPVAREVERIRAALLGNQVIVVAGETGSGKTTQLPKLCLEAGRGWRPGPSPSALPASCSRSWAPQWAIRCAFTIRFQMAPISS